MHSRAKTNSDNHLIYVIYDWLSSEDESADDFGRDAFDSASVAIHELPVKLLVGSLPETTI